MFIICFVTVVLTENVLWTKVQLTSIINKSCKKYTLGPRHWKASIGQYLNISVFRYCKISNTLSCLDSINIPWFWYFGIFLMFQYFHSSKLVLKYSHFSSNKQMHKTEYRKQNKTKQRTKTNKNKTKKKQKQKRNKTKKKQNKAKKTRRYRVSLKKV